MSEKQPKKYDVVLGGQSDRSHAPLDGVVLGNLSRFTVDLQSLLQQQKWQAADLETQRIMLDICQRQTAGFFAGRRSSQN
jgi:hypothetical protein